MAAALNLDVIVEGIETSQQASYFAEADAPFSRRAGSSDARCRRIEFRRLLDGDVKRTVVSAETPEESASAMPFQVA